MTESVQTFDIAAASTSVSVPARKWLNFYNSGDVTIYVNPTGGPAALTGVENIPIRPGGSLPMPPLGSHRIYAISRVAGGRLTVMAAETPITSIPEHGKRTESIVRSFSDTAANDADRTIYNIATDFIGTAGGHAVRAVRLECVTNAQCIRFEAGVPGVPGGAESITLQAGDVLTLDDLELINSIHARNQTAGQNGTVRGEAKGA